MREVIGLDARALVASLMGRLSPEQQVQLRWRLRRLARPAWLGTIRRTSPLSERWGLDRGTPVDRWYIEEFLGNHQADIQGRVLEVKDSGYANRFGRQVTRFDVLDIDPSNPKATLIADLSAANDIGADQFDCFVLTQTLQFIENPAAAISHAHRILRPGGVLLCTVPAVSRIDGALHDVDYWRFTPASCSRLFGDGFPGGDVSVRSFGNVLSAVAFLIGMASEELSSRELNVQDAYYPVIVGVRAVKSGLADDCPASNWASPEGREAPAGKHRGG